jgi:hypothetical protein
MGYKKSRSGIQRVKQRSASGLTSRYPRILSMTKHKGYDLVRPIFVSGKLRLFSDIFNFELVPKTVVAKDLGKEKGRFNELIGNPNEFIYQEIRLFSSWCAMASFEMGILIETEHPGHAMTTDRSKPDKYAAIKPMVIDKQITRLEDIFDYFHKSSIAKEIGRKATTLDRYLKNVDNFPLKDIRAIGDLFDLKLSEMLKLIEAETQ